VLSACTDAGAGGWVVGAVRNFDYTVGSVVPPVFDAYVRVFHPGSRGVGKDAVEVRWADVAAANDRVMHAAAEWGSLTGSWQLQGQPGIWDQEPSTGELPGSVALRLAPILANYTTEAQHCRFALWAGYGEPTLAFGFADGPCEELRRRMQDAAEVEIRDWRGLIEGAAVLRLPDRPMWLLEGPLAAVREFYAHYRHPPNLWWPRDRAWCVGTEVDLMTTYIAGSSELVDALLADDRLEALAVSADQFVHWETDTINPLPAPP
jgi:hypothetical protein